MLFDKRFGCLEVEIIKEEQTFIKAVGLYLVNAFEVGFCLLGFTRSTRPRNLKSFSIILTRCTTTPNYLSGEESRNWRRSHASHQRKQSVTELALASGKLTKDDLVRNSTFATSETPSRRPYPRAWLRETLCLYLVLSAIPRRPKEDIILGGYHIPGGTAQVEFLVHQMGRDESIFEDAEAFKPERWLRNKDITLIESAEAFASLPFGFGTRMCLGRRISELELHLLMARIVQQFDISYSPEAENVEPFMRGATICDRPVTVQFVGQQSAIPYINFLLVINEPFRDVHLIKRSETVAAEGK